jgi:hypothetical protein
MFGAVESGFHLQGLHLLLTVSGSLDLLTQAISMTRLMGLDRGEYIPHVFYDLPSLLVSIRPTTCISLCRTLMLFFSRLLVRLNLDLARKKVSGSCDSRTDCNIRHETPILRCFNLKVGR